MCIEAQTTNLTLLEQGLWLEYAKTPLYIGISPGILRLLKYKLDNCGLFLIFKNTDIIQLMLFFSYSKLQDGHDIETASFKRSLGSQENGKNWDNCKNLVPMWIACFASGTHFIFWIWANRFFFCWWLVTLVTGRRREITKPLLLRRRKREDGAEDTSLPASTCWSEGNRRHSSHCWVTPRTGGRVVGVGGWCSNASATLCRRGLWQPHQYCLLGQGICLPVDYASFLPEFFPFQFSFVNFFFQKRGCLPPRISSMLNCPEFWAQVFLIRFNPPAPVSSAF